MKKSIIIIILIVAFVYGMSWYKKQEGDLTTIANTLYQEAVTKITILKQKIEGVPIILSSSEEKITSTNTTTLRKQMLTAVNNQRTTNGVPGVKVNTTLHTIAQAYAEYLAQTDDFAHITKKGETPADRAINGGYNYQAIAENLAYGQFTIEEVIADRMKSEGHKKNILSKLYEEIGIGYASGYRVQVFGTQIKK